MTDQPFETRTFESGDIIIREGETGSEAYLIESGFVSVTTGTEGQPVALGTRAEGEIIGEMALLDDSPRSATVTANDTVTCRVIKRADLEGLLDGTPETLQILVQQMLESLRVANDMIGMYAERCAVNESNP